ncbi:unnamed protein product [Mesocestoides corti]|uniref:Calcium-activated potassium channel subunit beta-3 n=2 Tax=Mesocestoides corti TaxID=53468 RepID=A0A158QSS1_MESCO|nr:unnamed protein product [Mesocestoides corti]
MVIRSFQGSHSARTLIKVVYIVCAAILTTSVIVESFLVHMLVLPYFHESEFEPGICTVVKIELKPSGRLKCENKCSKERSTFPCLQVTIVFEKDNRNRTGFLFDTIVTHQNYRHYGCATSSCYQRQEENDFVVQMFRLSLQSRGQFQCFVSAMHDDEALMYKVYQPSTIFHALFWPLGFFAISLTLIISLYIVDRCEVWNADSLLIT